jgi:hypothetical protein
MGPERELEPDIPWGEKKIKGRLGGHGVRYNPQTGENHPQSTQRPGS